MGYPVRLIAGPGHRGESLYAARLIEGYTPDYVMADRGYDANHFHDAILEAGAEPVIPPMPQRKHQHKYDKTLYKERNKIERFFNRLKHFRRVATRYDKLVRNFMGFVKLAAIAIWIK